jgi:hypothetical protein
VSSLLSKHNEAWTYSVAINDVYYENAARPCAPAA